MTKTYPRFLFALALLISGFSALGVLTDLGASTLPGFSVVPVAQPAGFVSSIVTDSRGILYYTVTSGTIYRLDGAASVAVAHLPAEAVGNAGLLGMALVSDSVAVVHYTTAGQTYEVISRVDLRSGVETVLHSFVCNIVRPAEGVSSEHHGGNPIVAPDGSIYFAIGDFFVPYTAADPLWNSGKIWRVLPDGSAQQVASGFRNPFDMAWDPEHGRLIVPDNGDVVDDEINIVTPAGGFFGWPWTAGSQPPVDGAISPAYVFPTIVAPTGIVRLSGHNSMLPRGYLLALFVPRAVAYIADIDSIPITPIRLVEAESDAVVDVTEGPGGEIYFAAGAMIYRLVPPRPGDCNGDGVIDFSDAGAIELELADGDPHPATRAQDGLYRGSWGCDANGDGLISSADREAFWRLMTSRVRAVRR